MLFLFLLLGFVTAATDDYYDQTVITHAGAYLLHCGVQCFRNLTFTHITIHANGKRVLQYIGGKGRMMHSTEIVLSLATGVLVECRAFGADLDSRECKAGCYAKEVNPEFTGDDFWFS